MDKKQYYKNRENIRILRNYIKYQESLGSEQDPFDYILFGKTAEAMRLRQCATSLLSEYMVKGFLLDDERLKGETEDEDADFYQQFQHTFNFDKS